MIALISSKRLQELLAKEAVLDAMPTGQAEFVSGWMNTPDIDVAKELAEARKELAIAKKCCDERSAAMHQIARVERRIAKLLVGVKS